MTTTTNDDLRDALAAAEARWQRHVEVLGWAPDHRIRGPEDAFTAGQELSHHAHWLEYALASLRAARGDGPEPAPLEDSDVQNAAWATGDASRSYEDALAWCARVREEYLDYVAQVVETRGASDAVGDLRDYLVAHFDQHFGYLVEGELRHEAAEWERLTAYLDIHSEGVLHTSEDGREWHAADIYAHLERWMRVNTPRVETFLSTAALPDLEASVDELNARWLREDQGIAFADARERAIRSRDEFVAQVRAVPTDRWTSRLAGLFHGNARGHYLLHLRYIEG